jgi:glycosyltransferase involved in cell wall biosynthesis
MPAALFDASRLVFRAAKGGALTGIDRVAMAYGRWLLSWPDVEVVGCWSFKGRTFPVPQDLLRWLAEPREQRAAPETSVWPELAAALAAPDATVPALRARPSRGEGLAGDGWLLEALRRATTVWPSTRMSPGDFYVNVSHYALGQGGLLGRLAARGLRPVVMIHDLIPIAHPEYCTPGGAPKHATRMSAVFDHAALVIANSRATADEIAVYAEQTGRVAPPLCVAPLGLEPAFLAPREERLSPAPYFVCVGTIEPRKNLAFLLTVWRRLAERMGAATPALVLVGRRGWENESVVDLLERSPAIERHVHEVCDLKDEELARLVSGATALLAPSFTEGFDLPSVEALALGTPLIASDIPVHRELAGGAQLIDPLDGLGWLAAIEAAALHPPPRRACAPPTWARHFELVAEAMGLAAAPEAGVVRRQAAGPAAIAGVTS